MQLKDAIQTLRHGIDTILNCDVSYEDMDAALIFIESKFSSPNKSSFQFPTASETVGAVQKSVPENLTSREKGLIGNAYLFIVGNKKR
ncbi:hypothetical protein ACFL5S_02210 [Fibrobacterota bacterium]